MEDNWMVPDVATTAELVYDESNVPGTMQPSSGTGAGHIAELPPTMDSVRNGERNCCRAVAAGILCAGLALHTILLDPVRCTDIQSPLCAGMCRCESRNKTGQSVGVD
jgi:hypothetical protein